jgi:hypothetical protein
MLARGELVEANGVRRQLTNVAGRKLVCEFLETGADEHLRSLLASRVRSREGLWIPAAGDEISQLWR